MSSHTLSSEAIFTGRVFTVLRDRVRLPHGPVATMDVIRHPPSVVLLPMPDPAQVILVRQYRYAIDRWIWELPAGSVDPGETPEAAASRECREEIGLEPGTLTWVGEMYPTPGYCDELMIFFTAGALREPAVAATPDEDENIEARVFTLGEARRLVRDGDAPDMKTAVGLGLL